MFTLGAFSPHINGCKSMGEISYQTAEDEEERRNERGGRVGKGRWQERKRERFPSLSLYAQLRLNLHLALCNLQSAILRPDQATSQRALRFLIN